MKYVFTLQKNQTVVRGECIEEYQHQEFTKEGYSIVTVEGKPKIFDKDMNKHYVPDEIEIDENGKIYVMSWNPLENGAEKRTRQLLFIGDSNWNYYYDIEYDYVLSVPKPGIEYLGCKASTFGGMKYFAQWLKEEINRDERLEGSLTKYGWAVLEHGIEDPQILKKYYEIRQ